MSRAPVVIVALSCKAAYLDRYAEPDKGWTDRDETHWPAPYWDIDTGMAALLVLLTAVDEGLGACFFGVPPERIAAFREEFGVPDDHQPIGAITLGHPAGERVAGSATHSEKADDGRRGAQRPLVIDHTRDERVRAPAADRGDGGQRVGQDHRR